MRTMITTRTMTCGSESQSSFVCNYCAANDEPNCGRYLHSSPSYFVLAPKEGEASLTSYAKLSFRWCIPLATPLRQVIEQEADALQGGCGIERRQQPDPPLLGLEHVLLQDLEGVVAVQNESLLGCGGGREGQLGCRALSCRWRLAAPCPPPSPPSSGRGPLGLVVECLGQIQLRRGAMDEPLRRAQEPPASPGSRHAYVCVSPTGPLSRQGQLEIAWLSTHPMRPPQ